MIKMATEQNMTQAITQVTTEAAKAGKLAVRETEVPNETRRAEDGAPK